MHFMTDRSPTLLFNFQTQNLARVPFCEGEILMKRSPKSNGLPARQSLGEGAAARSKSKRDCW
jgi:hypothetical protein